MTVLERAYAKINLTLDVRGLRADGFHEMDMVMQTVSLWDDVYITLLDTPEIEVDTNVDGLPRGTENLAGKAGRSFLDYVNMPDKGIKVNIIKRIPDRAGLAGGSADAAAVIRGLCRLLPETGLGLAEKLELCAGIGSDVAFCLVGGTKRAAGRGEVLSALPPMPECTAVLVKPAFSVSTPELFRAIDGCGICARPDAGKMAAALGRGDLEGVCREVGNVFEAALPADERLVVERIKGALLGSGARAASMTGTGSAVFGLFPPGKEADLRSLRGFGEVFFTKPVGDLV